LPVNSPRCGVAMISPRGVTRFCSGMGNQSTAVIPDCEGRVANRAC
jgi:hypothetical protein